MMKCSDDLIQMYVEGALQPAEAAILDAHLQECATCRRRAGLYKGLFWDLAQVGRLAPSAEGDEAEALTARLQAEWQRGRSPAPVSTAALATLWLTANPAARAVTSASLSALEAVGSASRSALEAMASRGLGALGRAGRMLLRRKGGGRR